MRRNRLAIVPGAQPPVDDATPQARSKRSKAWVKPLVMGITGVVVIVAVFVFIFPKFADYQTAFTSLRDLSPWWILVLAIAAIANVLVYPTTADAAIPHLPFRVAFISRQVSYLVSNVIPGGGAVAAGSQYSVLATYGVATPLAVAAVTADAAWTFLITLGAPSIAVALLVIEGRSTAAYLTAALIGLVVLVVALIVIIVALRSSDGARRLGARFQRPVDAVMRVIHRPAPNVGDALANFHEHAADMVARRWVRLTVTNIAAQFMPMIILGVALAALGGFPHPITLVELFAAYSIASLLTSVPLTPGGLGTVDAALIGLLVAFGLDSSTALAADLIWRLFWTLFQLLVGLGSFGWYTWDRRRGDRPLDPSAGMTNTGETADAH